MDGTQLRRGRREPFEGKDLFFISAVVVVAWLWTVVQSPQIVHFQWCISCMDYTSVKLTKLY